MQRFNCLISFAREGKRSAFGGKFQLHPATEDFLLLNASIDDIRSIITNEIFGPLTTEADKVEAERTWEMYHRPDENSFELDAGGGWVWGDDLLSVLRQPCYDADGLLTDKWSDKIQDQDSIPDHILLELDMEGLINSPEVTEEIG